MCSTCLATRRTTTSLLHTRSWVQPQNRFCEVQMVELGCRNRRLLRIIFYWLYALLFKDYLEHAGIKKWKIPEHSSTFWNHGDTLGWKLINKSALIFMIRVHPCELYSFCHPNPPNWESTENCNTYYTWRQILFLQKWSETTEPWHPEAKKTKSVQKIHIKSSSAWKN